MVYEIKAVSKDKQQYTIILESEPNKITETFNKHLEKIGWGQYCYRITAWREFNE